MTGLIDTFWRHFVVSTNFTEICLESRPYGPRWAPARVLYREGPAGHDRARRVVQDPSPPTVTSAAPRPPLRLPAGAYGPASLSGLAPRASVG